MSGLIQELRINDPPDGLDFALKGFGRDDAGELYALGGSSGTGGKVYKIGPIVAQPTILNLSTRLEVETGDNVGIGGFIVTGVISNRGPARAGPSARPTGVPATLRPCHNPKLELHDSSGGVIASNDDLDKSSRRRAKISALHLAPNDPSESALLPDLAPAIYTGLRSSSSIAASGPPISTGARGQAKRHRRECSEGSTQKLKQGAKSKVRRATHCSTADTIRP
jgi:hypothetical protein